MVGGVCPNSMDAVSDRDYVLEMAFFSSVLMVHLSRWEGGIKGMEEGGGCTGGRLSLGHPV